jgi:hypothetical protein
MHILAQHIGAFCSNVHVLCFFASKPTEAGWFFNDSAKIEDYVASGM